MVSLSCPLCHAPSVFPAPSALVAALASLCRQPVACPVLRCGHTCSGLDSLAQHLATHHAPAPAPAPVTSDTLEQVIQDLQDLVSTELELRPEPREISIAESCGPRVTEPPPAWPQDPALSPGSPLSWPPPLPDFSAHFPAPFPCSAPSPAPYPAPSPAPAPAPSTSTGGVIKGGSRIIVHFDYVGKLWHDQ